MEGEREKDEMRVRREETERIRVGPTGRPPQELDHDRPLYELVHDDRAIHPRPLSSPNCREPEQVRKPQIRAPRLRRDCRLSGDMLTGSTSHGNIFDQGHEPRI